MADSTYLERTLASIAINCETRGIKDPTKFIKALEKEHGAKLADMDEGSALRRVNRNLGASFEAFLGGQKRAS